MTEQKKRLIDAAVGRIEPDLVLKNARVINVFTEQIETADIAISDGIIVGLGIYSSSKEVDLGGKYVCSGFMDGHMHLESSLLSPAEFENAVLPHGTTGIIADPHEIANVAGKKGIEAMMQDAEGGLYDAYFAIPSNVPIMPEEFETSGGKISCEDMLELKEKEGIICLGEVMNFREIIQENTSEVGKFIDLVHDADPLYPLEGHCPSLIDLDLAKFLLKQLVLVVMSMLLI